VSAGLPDTLCMQLFATIETPRTLEQLPNGDILVGSPRSPTPGAAPTGLGGVFVLYDADGDGVADDEKSVLFSGEDSLHGIRYVESQERLYYSLSESVVSVPLKSGQLLFC
jgi:hypothetical protein